MTKEVKILLGIAIVIIIGGAALFFSAGSGEQAEPGVPTDETSLVRETSHTTGPSDAKVTVVEFADFQCPACGAAYPILKQVKEAYKDQSVRFVFRNFPLRSIHPNAQIAAEAAEAAAAQGKFWEMHDLLYERQSAWSSQTSPISTFADYARELGLNTDAFDQALKQRTYETLIDTDADDAGQLGLNSTPTFFINGTKYAQVLPFEKLKELVDAELAK